jgi:hypothetical protein
MASQRTHGVFLVLGGLEIEIKKVDVQFIIYRGKPSKDSKFGELGVSRGAVVWRGRKDHWGRKLSWSQVNKLFERFGRRSERRKKGARKTISRRARR